MNCKVLQLTDFDIRSLEVVKETILWLDGQDHCRWVLKTPAKSIGSTSGSMYLKVWNTTYIRRDNILTGLDVGFYDEQTTPALTGLIFHKGVCRGYATSHCTRYWRRPWEHRFYSLIQGKSLKTGYFTYQFSPYHVMRYKNQPSLIDLEGIYRLDALPELAKYHSRFDDRKYEQFVIDLYNSRSERKMNMPKRTPIKSTPPTWSTSFLVRTLKVLWRRSMEGCRKEKPITANHVFLIED